MNKIEKRVLEILKEGNWTFAQISNISMLIDNLAGQMYDELDAKAKLDLVWNDEIQDGEYTVPFGQIFSEQVERNLRERIAEIIKIELQDAKISFNKESDKNEVSERSVGRKSPKTRTTSSKRSSEEQE
jgi:hypothetical protein|tara:strand:+ start:188 stop:574 length:387 start_codon:yes stop_codon:yes gene_type:complete